MSYGESNDQLLWAKTNWKNNKLFSLFSRLALIFGSNIIVEVSVFTKYQPLKSIGLLVSAWNGVLALVPYKIWVLYSKLIDIKIANLNKKHSSDIANAVTKACYSFY